jgi:thioredoxin 1
MEMSGIIEITQDNFESVRAQTPLLVVDCWANWCGPCRQMGPIFEKVAEEHGQKASFGKLDCDKNPELVKQFKILAIPTLLFFKNGEIEDTIVGLVAKDEIEAKLRSLQ